VCGLAVLASTAVVKVACPFALKTTVPPARGVPPSSNVTVPVACVPVLVTVAVSVTLVPNDVVALVLSVRPVDVTAAWVTVCVRLFDVLAEKLPSPPYTALMVYEPRIEGVVVNVAWPVAVHSASGVSVPLSLKVTVPVDRLPALATVAVKVMLTPCAVVAPLFSVTLVVVVALSTVWVRLFDVLAEKLLSPP